LISKPVSEVLQLLAKTILATRLFHFSGVGFPKREIVGDWHGPSMRVNFFIKKGVFVVPCRDVGSLPGFVGLC